MLKWTSHLLLNGAWSSYSNYIYNWYLSSSTTGTKYVYAWYKDTAGNITSRTYDTIYYQGAIYPSGSVSINGGASTTTSKYVSLTISASNATTMCISAYGYCSPNQSYSTSASATLAGDANEYNTIYVTLGSSTGNTTTISDSIYYSVSSVSKPKISSHLNDGGNYPSNTYVYTTCSSSGAVITSFITHDDSSQFHSDWDDYGYTYGDDYTKTNVIQMASASIYQCPVGYCTYNIYSSCSNSAGTTSKVYTFYLAVTYY